MARILLRYVPAYNIQYRGINAMSTSVSSYVFHLSCIVANFAMFDVPLFVFFFGPQMGLRASGVIVSDQDAHYPAAYDASLIIYNISVIALTSTLGLIPAVMMNCSPHASEYRTFIILGFPLVSAVTCAVALNQVWCDRISVRVGVSLFIHTIHRRHFCFLFVAICRCDWNFGRRCDPLLHPGPRYM